MFVNSTPRVSKRVSSRRGLIRNSSDTSTELRYASASKSTSSESSERTSIRARSPSHQVSRSTRLPVSAFAFVGSAARLPKPCQEASNRVRAPGVHPTFTSPFRISSSVLGIASPLPSRTGAEVPPRVKLASASSGSFAVNAVNDWPKSRPFDWNPTR